MTPQVAITIIALIIIIVAVIGIAWINILK